MFETRIKAAIKASGDDTTKEKIDALVEAEIEKQRRILHEEFEKKVRHTQIVNSPTRGNLGFIFLRENSRH